LRSRCSLPRSLFWLGPLSSSPLLRKYPHLRPFILLIHLSLQYSRTPFSSPAAGKGRNGVSCHLPRWAVELIDVECRR
jgi:hypothetical protein